MRAVGNYLKRWGFTPQKPIKRAYERRPEAIQKWLDDEYPAIAERAKDENCEIHWGDETALINTDVRGRSYAPKGQTPVTCAPGKREKLSMISTVTNQGKTRWMVIDGNFDAGKLIEFLEALIKDAVRKIFLILDNLRAHHSKLVKAWLEERKDHRSLLFAQLCPRTQSRRASQRRYEARHQHQGSGAYQGEAQSCCRGAYGHDRAIPRSGACLLPGSAR